VVVRRSALSGIRVFGFLDHIYTRGMQNMTWKKHPWEAIYATDGRVFEEPFPGFDEVVRIFKQNRCKRILDLGCGSGRHSVHLASEGFSVLGADIAQSGLKLADRWAHEAGLKLPFIQADTRVGLPFAAAAFDGVLSTQVIHHALLAQIQRTIKGIQRILAPGGVAFITVASRKDEGIQFEEVEPGTLIPMTGSEAGLPHHIFDEEELRYEFRTFRILDLTSRADGKVLAIWVRNPLLEKPDLSRDERKSGT
jgi:SAM-dependent methyltransferase